jgi:hypothetical protein
MGGGLVNTVARNDHYSMRDLGARVWGVWNNPLVPLKTRSEYPMLITGGASVEPRGTPTMEGLVLERKTSRV